MATTDAPAMVPTPVNPPKPADSDADDDVLLNDIPVPAPKAANPAPAITPAQTVPEAPAKPLNLPAPVPLTDNGGSVDDAFKRNIEAAEKAEGWLNRNIVPIMAILVTVLSFAFFFYAVVFIDYTKDTIKKDVVIYLLGSVSAVIMGVIGYYFGSSKGSNDKSATIAKFASRL